MSSLLFSITSLPHIGKNEQEKDAVMKQKKYKF